MRRPGRAISSTPRNPRLALQQQQQRTPLSRTARSPFDDRPIGHQQQYSLCDSREPSAGASASPERATPPSRWAAMPVLPHSLPRRVAAAVAEDTRILDSRELATAARRAAATLPQHTRHLLRRISSPATLLTKRNNNDPACQAGYIAGCYQFGGATPPAVVGIVLGAIAGFLLIMWLLWVLSNGTTFIQTSNLQEEDVVVRRRSRSPGRSTRRSHRSTYREEMRHSSPRRERVIRQERIVRDVPPPRMDSSRVRETVIVEERGPDRRVDGDDIVEVIEEHSSIGGAPPPRRKSKRSSGYR